MKCEKIEVETHDLVAANTYLTEYLAELVNGGSIVLSDEQWKLVMAGASAQQVVDLAKNNNGE